MAKKGGDSGAAEARADEQARQQRVRSGTTRIDDIFKNQFTEDFYNGRNTGYVDFAKPQLDEQFGDAKEKLTFNLARSGTLNSSVRADKEAELQREYDKNRRTISDEALNQTNRARTSVEDARVGLVSSLNATGDDAGAANSAIARATALSAPAGYSALGPLFANFTSALGTQAAMERAQMLSGGAVKAPFDTGLFSGSGAVKVTR